MNEFQDLLQLIFSPVGVWTISALIGVLVTGLALRGALSDLTDLGDIQNGRRMLARSNVEDEASRFVILLSWLAMGVMYVFFGDTPRHSIVGWVIVSGNVILTVNSLRRTRVRQYIRRLGRSQTPVDETRDQREDREFGEQRRELETLHQEEDSGG